MRICQCIWLLVLAMQVYAGAGEGETPMYLVPAKMDGFYFLPDQTMTAPLDCRDFENGSDVEYNGRYYRIPYGNIDIQTILSLVKESGNSTQKKSQDFRRLFAMAKEQDWDGIELEWWRETDRSVRVIGSAILILEKDQKRKLLINSSRFEDAEKKARIEEIEVVEKFKNEFRSLLKTEKLPEP